MNERSSNSQGYGYGSGRRSLADSKQRLLEKHRNLSTISPQTTIFEDSRGIVPVSDGLLKDAARTVVDYLDELA